MVITKTKFINYTRCPRYVALEEIKENELEADITLEEYRQEERERIISEIYDTMFDEEGESIIDLKDQTLETLMPYYKEIELLAANQAKKQLGGNPISFYNNLNQESFDFTENGIKYLCYVDIYNDKGDLFDIIEVKATTSDKFLKLGPSKKNTAGESEYLSIFKQKEDGIYYLKDEIKGYKIEDEMPLTKYYQHKQKLSNRYHSCGRYVYDLLVQRMIVEGYLKENNQEDKIDKIKYYLGVLNSQYVFDGTYDENGKLKYDPDENGNDIIVFFDFTNLTKELLDKVKLDCQKLETYLKEMNIKQCDLGIHCEHNKNTKCKFLDVCFYKVVPKVNSILNYLDYSYGFKDEDGYKYSSFELINSGKVHMLDLEEKMLNRPKNIIQRKVVLTNKPYIDLIKIKDGLTQLEYPLYYLDFETFPCPLPRYKGEKCYTQSVFQFSLHIEREIEICHKDKDHYTYLAINHDDFREELVKKLCECIDLEKGMIIVYNQSFEKARLKELANIFPEYKSKLLKMREKMFDLLHLIKGNTNLYKSLGYDEIKASLFNYYHPQLNGSYSIKKVLPIFAPNLNYDKLAISNGNEALITYACFSLFSKAKLKKAIKNLLEYCKQDTWAMVIILNKLREIVK